MCQENFKKHTQKGETCYFKRYGIFRLSGARSPSWFTRVDFARYGTKVKICTAYENIKFWRLICARARRNVFCLVAQFSRP